MQYLTFIIDHQIKFNVSYGLTFPHSRAEPCSVTLTWCREIFVYKRTSLAAVMVNKKTEQRVNIKFIFKFKKTATEAYVEGTYIKQCQKLLQGMLRPLNS